MKSPSIILTLLAVGLCAGNAQLAAAEAGESWLWRNPLPTGATLESVAYGSGLYVAVGESGTVLISPDGANWSREPSGTQVRLRGVAYAEGTFIAVGDSGTVGRSSGGTNWTAQVLASEVNFRAVAHGGGRFVALGAALTNSGVAAFWTSSDGLVWSANGTMSPAGGA